MFAGLLVCFRVSVKLFSHRYRDPKRKQSMNLKESCELMLLFLSLILDSSLVRLIVDAQRWLNTGLFKCEKKNSLLRPAIQFKDSVLACQV